MVIQISFIRRWRFRFAGACWPWITLEWLNRSSVMTGINFTIFETIFRLVGMEQLLNTQLTLPLVVHVFTSSASDFYYMKLLETRKRLRQLSSRFEFPNKSHKIVNTIKWKCFYCRLIICELIEFNYTHRFKIVLVYSGSATKRFNFRFHSCRFGETEEIEECC